MWIDYYSKWETLAEILFDLQTGELRFTRAAFGAPYSGTLSRNRIEGSFVYQGVLIRGKRDALNSINGSGERDSPRASPAHQAFVLSQVLLTNANTSTFQR